MWDHLNLYTHDGILHADEVFSAAMFSLIARDFHLVRGPENQVPEGPDWIVFDIGGGELDHHSRENRERNGTHPGTEIPYASCGLVWKKYHAEILRELGCPEEYLEDAYMNVDRSLIQGIDAEDNVYNPTAELLKGIDVLSKEQKDEILRTSTFNMPVTSVMADFNPCWNSDLDIQKCFMDAVAMAREILVRRIKRVISLLDARDFVQNAIDHSTGHLLLLEKYVPWEETLYGQPDNPKAMDIWYVIYLGVRGGWTMQCVRVEAEDKKRFRHPLPEAWCGFRGQELKEITGVKDAMFCHISGFLCVAESREGILELARIAGNQ